MAEATVAVPGDTPPPTPLKQVHSNPLGDQKPAGQTTLESGLNTCGLRISSALMGCDPEEGEDGEPDVEAPRFRERTRAEVSPVSK